MKIRQKRKILMIILITTILANIILSITNVNAETGSIEDLFDMPWDGTTEEPTTTRQIEGQTYYEISNAKQLAYIAKTGGEWLKKNYIQTKNIIINGEEIKYNYKTGALVTEAKKLRQWTTIGGNGDSFEGIFDGDGYTISGLYINREYRTDPQDPCEGIRIIWSNIWRRN